MSGPKLEVTYREMIVELQLEGQGGFRDLVSVLDGGGPSLTREREIRVLDVQIHSGNRRLAGRLFEPRTSTDGESSNTGSCGIALRTWFEQSTRRLRSPCTGGMSELGLDLPDL